MPEGLAQIKVQEHREISCSKLPAEDWARLNSIPRMPKPASQIEVWELDGDSASWGTPWPWDDLENDLENDLAFADPPPEE